MSLRAPFSSINENVRRKQIDTFKQQKQQQQVRDSRSL